MKKRLLSVLLSLCMVLSLLPAVSPMVSAAAPTAVYVGGINVVGGGYWFGDGVGGITSDGANASNYTVHYDSATNTLTLNGANITECHEWSTYYTAAIAANGDLNLELLGDNYVTGKDFDYSYGVYQSNGTLTISGSGTLTATGGTATNGYSFGILADSLIINGSIITAQGGTSNASNSNGIVAMTSISITDGTVIAYGGLAPTGTFSTSTGLSSNGSISISGGSVTATADNAYYASYGVFGVANVTISGDAVVRATSGEVTDSSGRSHGVATNMSDGSIIISGGSVTAQSGAATTSSAIRFAPNLTEYAGCEWRTSDSGTFTTDAYTWSATDTYVEFRQDPASVTHTITASAGAGGTITPSGSVTVSDGADQSFAITPASGYAVADVLVDGTSVGAVSSYTFANVTDNHTIAATFRTSGGSGNTGGGTSSGDSTDSIRDSATGIRAQGEISGSLTISLLTDTATGRANEVVNPIVYSELLQSVGSGHAVIGAYEIKASGYSGNLILTFPVDARHNGKQYVVKHKTTSGTIQTYRGTVLDGKIVISVSELSPFMIAITDQVQIPETGAAGFFGSTMAMLRSWFYRVWGLA